MSLREGPEEKLVERENERSWGVAEEAVVVREERKGWLNMEIGNLALTTGDSSCSFTDSFIATTKTSIQIMFYKLRKL